jgi:tetratricopeptide (TPR) repeat protein
MVCARCGHTSSSDAGRCPTCGAPLADAGVVTGVVPIDTTGLPPGATFGASNPSAIGSAPTIGHARTIGYEPTLGGGTIGPEPTFEAEATIAAEAAFTGTAAPAPRDAGPLKVGQAFGPRYHIIKLLGAGGMGAVYQAWDEELGVAVALKVIRTSKRRVPADLEKRFKNELLLARSVTHKNVVRIHDLGEIEGKKFITMSYVQGHDLSTLLRRDGKCPIARALHLARQIAAGLEAAHEAGVVHRDLKPANIMIGAAGNDELALIMDFGISASAEQATSGSIVGTLEYMAPEQGSGRAVDGRADIYAFGLILYELLTGPRLVMSATPSVRVEAMKYRTTTGLPSVHAIDGSIPGALDAVVTRCLERDPAARFQTTAELVAALGALDDAGELIPIARRLTRPMMAAIAAIVVLLLGGTYYGTRRLLTPPKAHDIVPVLIADFQNRTGDPSFEGSVEQALTLAMEGASYVRVYARKDAHELAAQLNPAGGGRIDGRVGTLIAQREGIKVLLDGVIERTPGGIRVSLDAVNPADGKAITKVSTTAADKSQIVPAVGVLARRIREQLGESQRDTARFPESFTTTSLDAMLAFVRGQDLLERGSYVASIEAFQQAIALDPEFGRAYALIGTVYTNLKELDKADAYFQQALKRVDRMTEREKYRTLAGYYLFVAGNYQKAIDNYETLLRLYPAEAAPYNNLSLAYLYERNIPKAMEVARKGVEELPKSAVRRTNYADYAMYAADFKTAMAEATRVVKDNPSYDFAYLPLAVSSIASGDIQSGRETFARLHTVSATGDSLARLGEADLEMYLGRYKVAVRILTEGIERDVKSGNRGMAAAKSVALAESWLALGDRSQAAAAARRAVSLNDHESVRYPAARVLIACDRTDEARAIASTLLTKLQTQTTAYARLIEGEIALRATRWNDAIDALRDAQKRDRTVGNDSWFVHYLLGTVYWQSGGHAPEALEEFEQCLKRRGETTDIFFYDTPTLRYLPPLFYWAARAQEAVGAPSSARANYDQFVKIRGSADPPDPLLADARTRTPR